MFDGFSDERIALGEVELRVRHAGAGVPLFLGGVDVGENWEEIDVDDPRRGVTPPAAGAQSSCPRAMEGHGLTEVER